MEPLNRCIVALTISAALLLGAILWLAFWSPASPTPPRTTPATNQVPSSIREESNITVAPKVEHTPKPNPEEVAESRVGSSRRKFVIHGLITADGKPVGNARGGAQPIEFSATGRKHIEFDTHGSTSSDDGQMEIAASVQAEADTPEMLWAIAAYHPDFGSGYREVVLGELGANDLVELELVRGKGVEGRVIDQEGKPVVGARIGIDAMWPLDGVPLRGSLVTETDDQGVFSLCGIRFDNVPLSVVVVYPQSDISDIEALSAEERSTAIEAAIEQEDKAPKFSIAAESFHEANQTWRLGDLAIQGATGR